MRNVMMKKTEMMKGAEIAKKKKKKKTLNERIKNARMYK